MQADDKPPNAAAVRRRSILFPAVVWGAMAFLFTCGAIYYFDPNHPLLQRAGEYLFPNASRVSRENYIAIVVGTIPPLVLSTIAGIWHRSWLVGFGALLTYAIPVGLFFLMIQPVFW